MWVDEFLVVLPRRLFETLSAASVRDPAVRELVDHVLRQRAEARASGVESATPGELRTDLIKLLRGLDEQAWTGRLPPYLPAGADVTALSRTVRVRLEVRTCPADPPGDDNPGEEEGSVYWLPCGTPPEQEARRGRGRRSLRSTGGSWCWPTPVWASRGWSAPKLTGSAARRWPALSRGRGP